MNDSLKALAGTAIPVAAVFWSVLHFKLIPWTVHYLISLIEDHQKEVTELARAAPILTAFCSAIALVATITAAFIAVRTFFRAKQQLEATTVYTMQRDGRELMSAIRREPLVYNYIFRDDLSGASPETQINATNFIKTLIQYYSALYSQKEANIISRKIWKTVLYEMSELFKHPATRNVWYSVSQGYDAAFRELCNKLVRS